MITYNSPKFNNICEKIQEILLNNNIDINDSLQSLDDNIISSISEYVTNFLASPSDFVHLPCPKCAKTHLVLIQNNYSRNVIFKISNVLVKVHISIPRLKCKNCGSTHAVLPVFCIPFKQYSKQAVLDIVSLASKTSTQHVADDLNIEPKQVRRFISTFKSFKNKVLLLFQSHPSNFTVKINTNFKFHEIIDSFPTNFDELYFDEYRSIYLYVKFNRQIYIGFGNYQDKKT